MSQDAPRDMLARLGLTQTGAARLLGVGDRTMRHWCEVPGAPGYREMPETVRRILAMIEEVPGVRNWLEDVSAHRLPIA